MNLQTIKDQNLIIFECESGSHAYNLNIPTSDVDTRGIFKMPKDTYLKVSSVPQQVSDDKQDTIFFELRRYIELAMMVNPNIIELLWIDPKNIRTMSPAMEKLRANRNLFISTRAFHTFGGYAFAQIKKAKGQNKRVWNPKPEKRPSQLDFCRFIDFDDYLTYYTVSKSRGKTPEMMPSRPMPLTKAGIDLTKCHCAKLEHVPYVYRLYHYGDEAKGVFRGDESTGLMLVTENIPIEDEWKKFIGLLVFNEDEYNHEIVEWQNYWEWMKNRNESRWVSQETGQVNYDIKNMMHCFRLLISAKNILVNGEPVVRFADDSDDRKFLMKVRNGEFKYEELMPRVEAGMVELEELYKTSKVQHSVDQNKIDELFLELVNM